MQVGTVSNKRWTTDEILRVYLERENFVGIDESYIKFIGTSLISQKIQKKNFFLHSK